MAVVRSLLIRRVLSGRPATSWGGEAAAVASGYAWQVVAGEVLEVDRAALEPELLSDLAARLQVDLHIG